MALFDKVKAQAEQVAQRAQEVGKAGQAKLDQAQAKRQEDSLLRDLGAAVYAERTRQAGADSASEIDRLIAEITSLRTEQAPLAETGNPTEAAPTGDFKLD